MLRPGELYELRLSDVLIEESAEAPIIVRIWKSQMWVRGARGQYAKLEGKYVSGWARLLLRRMAPSELFWPAVPGAFALRFKLLLEKVLTFEGPFTPGSLRTGGHVGLP